VQRRWLVANAASLMVMAACGLAGYALRQTLGVERAQPGDAAWVAYIAAETGLSVVSFAVYACQTGTVLRTLVPLPVRTWIALHVVMGVVVGPPLGMLGTIPGDPEPLTWSGDMLLATLLFVFFALAGALIGAIIGGLETLVLRKAATGMRVWIAVSALSTSVAATLMPASQPLAPPHAPLIAEVISEAALMLGGMLAAVIMFRALANLRPKTG
jgi:hypothetical protein